MKALPKISKIEGLSQGKYKAHLLIFTSTDGAQPNFPKVEQAITITGNARQEITLILDLSKKEGEQ
jgi:hypothetical protein